MRKYLAEMVGTFVLVLMGCGSAIFSGFDNPTNASTLAVAFAFGLSVIGMAYAIGGVSGCHINPAITLGVWANGRMDGKQAAGYMVFQVIGAIIASFVLWLLVSNGTHEGGTTTGANSYADGNMWQAFIAETVFTFIFVLVVLGSTDEKQGAGKFAGLAIGLTLVLVHIVCIPLTGTSVNPARSVGPAIFAAFGGDATPISQLWLFIVAPFLGALASSSVWNIIRTK